MVYCVRYDDELRIWWDVRKDKTDKMQYKVTVDNKSCVYTNSIYYNFKNLEQSKEYEFKVQVVDENYNIVGKTEYFKAQTLNKRNVVNISKQPYNAIGDDNKDNTEIFQNALNECSENSQLVIPFGVYLCDKVTFSGNVDIKIEMGAKMVCKTEKNNAL